MIILTSHAQERIEKRLNRLVTIQEVTERVNRFHVTARRYYVEIKRIPYTEITDDNVKPDGITRGDSLVAIVESGRVETVMLRKSWSKSKEFNKIYRRP